MRLQTRMHTTMRKLHRFFTQEAKMFHVVINSVPANLEFMLDRRAQFDNKRDAENWLDHYATEFRCYGYIWDDSKSFWENQKLTNGREPVTCCIGDFRKSY